MAMFIHEAVHRRITELRARWGKVIMTRVFFDGFAELFRWDYYFSDSDMEKARKEQLAQRVPCEGERPTCPDCQGCSLNRTLPELEAEAMTKVGPGASLDDPEWKSDYGH